MRKKILTYTSKLGDFGTIEESKDAQTFIDLRRRLPEGATNIKHEYSDTIKIPAKEESVREVFTPAQLAKIQEMIDATGGN